MNNSIFNALNNIDDRHIRAEELAALDSGYSAEHGSRKPKLSKKIYIAIVAAATVASLCIGATAGATMARGFVTKEGYSNDFNQPTLTFSAANSQNCPETIERFYLPTAVPEDKGYRYSSSLNDKKTAFYALYVKDNDNIVFASGIFDVVSFSQWTKAEFSATFEVPGFVEVSETTVNGCPAYLIVIEHFYGSDVRIIWDNGDYIMGINHTAPVDEVMRLAESVAENDNALVKEG